ncbi:MAG: hypothetical protein M3434_06550 [Gemmatimonadota bacterium]|jgi:hypothetical protein|nr:hypothetical protein [Gemmatimonadota bacterium]
MRLDDISYKALIFEELLRSGVPTEQYAEAVQRLRGSSLQQLLELAGPAFSADERRELQALLQWPGCYASERPEGLPFPPALGNRTREELLRQAKRSGIEANACTVLVYMDARARAFWRLAAQGHAA